MAGVCTATAWLNAWLSVCLFVCWFVRSFRPLADFFPWERGVACHWLAVGLAGVQADGQEHVSDVFGCSVCVCVCVCV